MQAALTYFLSDWKLPCILPLVYSQILGADHIKSTGVTLSCFHVELTFLISLQYETVMNYFS